jgi:hypothetical protein
LTPRASALLPIAAAGARGHVDQIALSARFFE